MVLLPNLERSERNDRLERITLNRRAKTQNKTNFRLEE